MFALREPWKGGVTNFGWKPPLTNPRYFTSQRSTSHATQSFITPGEPQLPQLFCPRMVHLLVGIISLMRIRGPSPGRSHGNADTLPLSHSADLDNNFTPESVVCLRTSIILCTVWLVIKHRYSWKSHIWSCMYYLAGYDCMINYRYY